MPLTYPNIDRVDPTRMSVRPPSPITTAAASANGVFWPTSDGAENALRHHLHGEIQQRHADHREKNRARNGARRLVHFAARHQRRLDAEEREDEHR